MSDDLLSILEPLLEKTMNFGADEVELFAMRRSDKTVNFESNNLKSATANEIEGVGIRILINKAFGFASVNSLNKDRIIKGVEEALAIAKIAQPEDYYFLPKKQPLTPIKELYDSEIENFSMDDTINLGNNLLKKALEYDKRVSVESGTFQADTTSRAIVTSAGVSFSEKKSSFTYGLVGMAIDGEDVGSFDGEFDAVVKVKDINTEKTATDYAEKVLQMLGAKKTDAFTGSMILTPDVVAELFGMLIYSVTATNIQSGSSYLQDKLGDKIAIDNLTMYDDGTMKNNTGSNSFDREGVPRKRLNIIEKGTFTGILYDAFTAHKEKLTSSGHASGTFRNIPVINPTNLFVEPGKSSIDDILGKIERGILVQRVSASPDPISGDFSGVIKGGKLIKNGTKTDTLKEITAVGNLFQGLKNISAISKEVKALRGIQNWFMPYIVIDNIKFVS